MPGKSCACSNSTKDAGYPCHKADCPTLKNEACKEHVQSTTVSYVSLLRDLKKTASEVGAKSALYSKK